MAETIAIIKRVLDTVRSNGNIDMISVKNDYGARFIEAVIAVDGKPIHVDQGAFVTIEAKRADMQSDAFSGAVNENGTVKVPITQWMLEIPNTSVEATVVVHSAKTKLSTTNFYIKVQNAPHGSEEISPDDPNYDILIQVLAGESGRVAAENARNENEDTRQVNEEERDEYEHFRREAEETRRLNELARAAAENTRISNENERASKDGERDAKIAEAVEKSNTAENTANEALSEAAGAKNSAVAAANAAAGSATEASNSANAADASAKNAATSEGSAQKYSQDAMTYANTASEHKNDAETSAQEADAARARAVEAKNFAEAAAQIANAAVTTGKDNALAEIEAKGEEVLASIPEDYANLVVQTPGNSENKVMSQKAVSELVGDLYDTNIPVGEITDGKYIVTSGILDNSPTSCATDFISVAEGFTLNIKNCFLEGNRSICTYDESKKVVECLIYNSAETEFTFTVPAGVSYIRITGKIGVSPSVTKISHPIDAEIDELKRKLLEVGDDVKSVENKLGDVLSSDITPIHSVSGKFIDSQGKLVVNAASTSYFIEALGGKTVILSGVNTEYSRAIVIYDISGNFKECVATNQLGVSEFTVDVEETSYIGFTALDENFSAKYKDFGIIKDEYIDFDKQAEKCAENEYIGNYLPARRKIAESTTEGGYLTAIGTVISDDNYRHTPFIEIEGGRDFIVTNLTPTANIALIFFDGRKNIIGTVPHEYTGVAMEMEFTAPRNAAYIRFSLLKADADRVFVTYKEPIERNAHEKSIINGWFSDSFNKITTLFGDYVKQPLITIIDDDTVDVQQVQTFRDVCTANGIKGTMACITKRAINNSELKNLLWDLEKEGFHVCLHCHEHTNVFQEPTFVLSTAEANIVQGCKDMEQLGFADWKFWITPGGESFPALQNLVRKWGFECVITSNINYDIETTEAKRGRWNISRPSWLTSEEETEGLIDGAGHLTLKGWKAKADEVVANGGWLLVNTHMYGGNDAQGWDDPTSKSRRDFAEFVAYAKSIGCTFTTLNEAWRIKAPIYKFYELFI